MSSKTKAIILGGFVIGAISAIPIIGWGWFLWAFLGGGLAAYLYIQGSEKAVETSEGLVIGTLAGVVGALINVIGYIIFQVIFIFIGALITFISSNNIEEGFIVVFINSLFSVFGSFIWLIVQFVLIIPIILFGLLGGLAGTAMFEQRTVTKPNNPNNFGG